MKIEELQADSRKQFQLAQDAFTDERQQCLDDRRFCYISGAQYEGRIGELFQNRPRIEINQVHLAVIRIINEYRNNKITADFVPDTDKDDADADLCDGLFRADEIDSNADDAYNSAFEEAVAGGFGAFRLRTKYEDEYSEDDDRQRIEFVPIHDADSCVFWDIGAKKQDKSDARFCWVLSPVPRDKFKEEWGQSPTEWPKTVTGQYFDWATPDSVYVSETYIVEDAKERVHVFRLIDGTEKKIKAHELKEDPQLEQDLHDTGARLIRTKTVKCRKVRKIIESGGGLLEDCGYIAGSLIPVVPVYGKRWVIDGLERCMGHVRLAKDAQRLNNMQMSSLAELAALSQQEVPIFLPEQVAGVVAQSWATANSDNAPYRIVNPIYDSMGQKVIGGPVGYTKPASVPPAMAALLELTQGQLGVLLGNQSGADKIVSNISGKAVELIQQRLDMQSYIYINNFAQSIKYAAKVWLSMAKEVYFEAGRKMKTVGPNGERGTVELMQPKTDGRGGLLVANNLERAKLSVSVDVGPSTSSKRAATVRELLGVMQMTDDPEVKQVVQGLAMANMEGEGLADARQFFRQKLIRAGVIKPNEQEAQALAQEAQNAQPDAQQAYMLALAQEAQANALQSQADSTLAIARAEETRAKTAKTLAEIDDMEQKQALTVIDKFGLPQPVAPSVVAVTPNKIFDFGEPPAPFQTGEQERPQ